MVKKHEVVLMNMFLWHKWEKKHIQCEPEAWEVFLLVLLKV